MFNPSRTFCGRPRWRRGFTLVELLVVVSVISILASLLMPTLLRSMAAAQITKCQSNLHQVHGGFLMYLKTYDTYLPAAGRPPTHSYWFDAFKPYLRDENVYSCPAFQKGKIGYGINHRFVHGERDTGMWCWPTGWYRMNIVKRPAGTILFGDAGDVLNPSAEPEDWIENTGGNVLGYMHFPQTSSFWTSWCRTTGERKRVMPRHLGAKTNVCFFDGHTDVYLARDLVDDWRGDPDCLYDNQ